MIKFISQKNHKSIIIFVHGFKGDENSWKFKDCQSFPELLLNVPEINSAFDVAHFSYYSKLLDSYSKDNMAALFRNIFKTSHKFLKKNISLDEVSSLLSSEIRFKLQNYDNIIVVAHSMGGLVTKSYIVNDIKKGSLPKVKLFISLAVPHMGAESATYGSLVSDNLHIEEMAPLNIFIHEINDYWQKTELRPLTKYFYGVHDKVVAKTSAAPIDKEESDFIAVEEDHSSISKPENDENTTFIAVKEIILKYGANDPAISELQIQSIEDYDGLEYDNELFVIKLIIAGIQPSSINVAKEVFLNAEYIRKMFNSTSDQKRFGELFKKVRSLYHDNYTNFVHGGIPNSGQLLAKVNSQITTEDRNFLSSKFLPFLNAIHKKGMLQQLANSESDNIWWTKETGMEMIEKFLEEKSDE